MPGGRRTRTALLALLALFALAGCGREARTRHALVVVERVEPGGAAQRGGVVEGDGLFSTRRGSLETPWQVAETETQEAPLGRVSLHVERAGGLVPLTLPAGEWRLAVRPFLEDADLERVARGQWDALAQSLVDAGRPADASWALVRAGAARLAVAQKAEAHAAFDAAASRAPGARVRARVLEAAAEAAQKGGDAEDAASRLEQALLARREAEQDGLGAARLLHLRGVFERGRGQGEAARGLLEEALALRRRLAPRSLETAMTLNNLGILEWQKGELDAAEGLYREALALCEPHGDTLEMARVLNNLGLVARDRGDLKTAEARLTRALAIRVALAPESWDVAANRVNMAALVQDRGDLEAADRLQREALAVFETLSPQGAEVAHTLNNMGLVARDRGDLEAAEERLRRALLLRESLAPDSLEVATTLSNLGGVVHERGRDAEARRLHERALLIRGERAPGSPDVARSLGNLARIDVAAGDTRRARLHLERALALDAARSRESPMVATDLHDLAHVARAEGRLADAEALLRRSLAIRRRLTPDSTQEAESWNALGQVLEAMGRQGEALEHYADAVLALERQQGRLGGSQDVRAAFGSRYRSLYQDWIFLLAKRGDAGAAFAAAERSRAREFLSLLASRDIAYPAEAPPAAVAALQRASLDYESLQSQIASRDPAVERAALDADLARLRELRDRRAQMQAELRTAAPRLDAILAPRTLGEGAARAALDPGTLMLSYVVGPRASLLFVLARDRPLRVVRIAAGEDALRTRVGAFLGLVARGRTEMEPEPALVEQAARLYADLLGPARAEIERCERLLVSPDGPLHALPFAALVAERAPRLYLAERKPLHTVVSATVYAGLVSSRRENTGGSLVAFGDPQRPEALGGLSELPGAREELDAIAATYGARARVLRGAAASEDAARHGLREARYVHFATHGLLDRRFPLDSALVLSPGGGGNGLLQAWEVFESVRLDADLVTLSACDSASGREAGGEGLIGLARAFQFAGARSVAASLWTVSDRSTARLMRAFYAGLHAGMAKDEALRQAQLSLLKTDARHPYAWAAFQLSGDWR
jgi:CHAT domain-containing protein/Tfp pilus assembly protein PilF